MAVSMDALLRIKADVQGKGAVDALAGGLGRLNATAAGASAGFKRLTGSMGGLVGGLQLLTPLATGAGLVGLATNSMQAAERMYDLSQSTGLTVEALSRFRRPAALAGTDIESVAKALQKLSKGVASGEGGAVDALKQLGVGTTDAAGRMKSADQILLEVADRFAAMPDGIQKTGLALELFGKAGAQMIPMLNMGGAELAKFKGITTDYAKQADEAGDAMVLLQGKVGMLGGQIAQVMLPFIIQATTALTGFVDGFTKLPGPLQVLIGGIATLVIAWGPLVGVLTTTLQLFGAISALQLGATIAGWAGAVVPAVGAMTVALSGFLAFLTGTFVPTLVAIFSGPVGWTVLAVAAVVAMAVAFREPIMGFLSWLGGALVQGFTAAWELAKGPVVAMGQWLGQRYEEFSELFRSRVAAPILSAWTAVTTAIPNAMRSAAETVQGIWTGVMNGIRSVVNGVLSSIVGGVNSAVAGVNRLIGSFNALPGPDVPFVPTLGIPQFARGGYVNRPTLAMIGEGGEGEYVVPESQVGGFARRVMAGQRGSNTIRPLGRSDELRSRLAAAQQRGDFRNLSTEGERVKRGQIARSLGFIPGAGSMPFTLRPGATASGGVRGGGVSVSVNTRVDRVIRQDGEDRVTLGQAQQMASDAARQAVAQMTQKLRQPSYRREVGIR